MAKKHKSTQKASSIPAGLGLAVICSMIVTLLGAMISAYLVGAETISQDSMKVASIVVIVISGAVGALVALNRIKRMRMQMCLLSGICYYIVLLSITGLFFDGQYNGLGMNGIAILCGCGGVAVLSILTKNRGKTHRRKPVYR